MSKLNKKIIALGDLTALGFEDIVAACGEPKEVRPVEFSDIGKGSRAVWSDGLFKIELNFDAEKRCCGLSYHKNYQSWLVIGLITLAICAAVLAWGAYMRAHSGGAGAQELYAQLTEQSEVWLSEDTAGAVLADLDADGLPELIATQTEMVWYEELEQLYFGESEVRVYSLTEGQVRHLGGFVTDEYCFLASLHRYTDAQGAVGWYYSSDGEVWDLVIGETVSGSVRDSMPDISGGDEALPLLNNESWVSAAGQAGQERIFSDLLAIVEQYYAS